MIYSWEQFLLLIEYWSDCKYFNKLDTKLEQRKHEPSIYSSALRTL
jgi:hypothetical protein